MNPLFNSGKRRKKRSQSVFEAEDGDLTLQREQVTEITTEGDLLTTEVVYSKIVGGEKISTHLDVAGKCQSCGRFVTPRSIRYCFCGKIVCAACSQWIEDEKRPACPECYKIWKRRRFWSRIFGFLLNWFTERKEL